MITLVRRIMLTLACAFVPLMLLADAQPSARGDVNADGTIDGSDVTYLANHLLGEGPAPVRSCLADVNADGSVSSADEVRLIDYIFAGGTPPPPQPAEVCNGMDDNCDTLIDEGVMTTYYADADGDTYGNPAISVQACVAPVGYVSRAGDCDDANSSVHPGATELCNNRDDNCDTVIDEGYDLSIDAHNCGTCGNECIGFHSTNPCIGGVCSPTCSFGWADCDNNPNNGCEVLIHTNPLCSTATFLGFVSGDTGATVLTASGHTEAFYRVTVKEENSSLFPLQDLRARVFLQVPAAVDFDLFVRCLNCSGNPVGSINPTGQSEELYFTHNDSLIADDTFDLLIEIRLFSTQNATAACTTQWQLTVQGNVDTTGHQVQSCP